MDNIDYTVPSNRSIKQYLVEWLLLQNRIIQGFVVFRKLYSEKNHWDTTILMMEMRRCLAMSVSWDNRCGKLKMLQHNWNLHVNELMNEEDQVREAARQAHGIVKLELETMKTLVRW